MQGSLPVGFFISNKVMARIPFQKIKDWCEKHPNDVFRCMMQIIETDGSVKNDGHVLVQYLKNYDLLFVAFERQIYNLTLGSFYADIGLCKKLEEIPNNFLLVYPCSNEDSLPIFGLFGKPEDIDADIERTQSMPWFSEDKCLKLHFQKEIYTYIQKT